MRWDRTLQLVDVHCGGEIGRVVMAGVLDVPGRTMADKMVHVNAVDDRLRRMLTFEPRGNPNGAVLLLTPPTRPEADVGFMLFLQDRAHAASGSNVMCATTALLETGAIAMAEPETTIVFDTAAGLLEATAHCQDGKVVSVTIAMPAGYVHEAGVIVDTPQWGPVAVDISFGGLFYGLVDAAAVGLEIVPENARALAAAGVALHEQLMDTVAVAHPEITALDFVSFVQFFSQGEDGAIVTANTLRPGRVDRCPCGTGSIALAARQASRGQLGVGDTLVTRSIIGSEFRTRIEATTKVGDHSAVKAALTGSCWIFGLSQIGVDPTDPFPEGYLLG